MSSWPGIGKKREAESELETIRAEIASIAKRVSGLAGDAGDTLKDNVENLRSRLPDQRDVTRAASDAVENGRDWLRRHSPDVRDGVSEAKAVVSRNPMAAIAIAAAAGFIVGVLACRGDDE